MPTAQKVVCRERQKRKQESFEYPLTPPRKKRGRKHHSPSPPSSRNPSTISFFKVMIGDFKDVLYIPPMAACTLKGLDKKYVSIEDANGKYWSVKISMVGGSLAFQKGWDDFFSAHSITAGEFVLFTYTGGLLFTARIFGTSSVERVDFQIKKRRGKCTRERCSTELRLDNVRPYKRKKASHASEDKESPSNKEPLRIFKRGKEAAHFDCPSVPVVESAPIYGVLKVSSSCEKPLQYVLNSKESENALSCSDRTWPSNVDATVKEVNTIEGLKIISPTKHAKSGTENLEVVDIRSIGNGVITTEKAASLFHSGVALVSKQEKEHDNMANSTIFTFKTHSDITEGLPEMIESYKMQINGKMEESNSHSPEILDSEMHNDNLDVLSNLKHVECSQMKFKRIESDGIIDKVDQTADGISYTLDEKLTELATVTSFNVKGQEEPICQNEHATFNSEILAPCETISLFSSNPKLICANNKNENLMLTNGEYGNFHINGSSIAESCLQRSTKVDECKYKSFPENSIDHDASINGDEKDVTPCSSCKNRGITETRESVDLPSSSCASFSVCLSDDVQSSLELPRKLACKMGKLKNGRKIVVLQDPSMKWWPVLYHQNLNFVGFLSGWADFARANNICRGDICGFELVNKMELKFRVHITKHRGSISGEKMEDGGTD